MEIAEQMKVARIHAGFTQEHVAEQILVTRQTISNWENGRSLPDIVSVIRLSELYQISLDELLKGDPKMIKKVEKDMLVFDQNKRLIVTTGIVVFITLATYACSIFIGGAFLDFCKAALPWILLGIGVACSTTYLSHKGDKIA